MKVNRYEPHRVGNPIQRVNFKLFTTKTTILTTYVSRIELLIPYGKY